MGREFTFEKTIERDGAANMTLLVRGRVFWVQRRQYNVQAVYSTELSVLPALDHFLDSFEYLAVPKPAGG